jgi:colanic acid/amylovoran biosynthesis glycosyltransferase
MLTYWHKLRVSKAWHYKIPGLLGFVYLGLFLSKSSFSNSFKYLIAAAITCIGIAGIGYVLNDISDIKVDAKAGKKNPFSKLGLLSRLFIVAVLMVVAISPWYFLPTDHISLYLLVIEFVLFVTYAVKPFRLKEAAYVAPVIDSLYAHVVPSILAFHTFSMYSTFESTTEIFIAMAVWQFMLGIRHYINHLAVESAIDRAADLRTLAHIISPHKLRNYIQYFLLPIEVCAVSILTYYLYQVDTILGVSTFAALVANWLLSTGFIPIRLIGGYSFNKIAQDDFYRIWWPLAILSCLSLFEPIYLLLLIIHIAVFYPLQHIDPKVLFVRRILSVFINHFIYYLRRFILLQSEQKARGKYYSQYLEEEKYKSKHLKSGTIAIFNINKDKYTETFVSGLENNLPYRVISFYGGDLPTQYGNNVSLLPSSILIRKWLFFWQSFTNKEDNYYLNRAIRVVLDQYRVKLIYCHFGPVGVKVEPIATAMGLPLIVNFHGYDVFHNGAVLDKQKAYKPIFENSNSIIAVSQSMKSELIRLGASSDKIIYLPAWVNYSLFSNIKRQPQPERFLYIGRFSETKSPHLVILAFAEVCKTYPSAKLIMIGKDGGGELYEACVMLIKSLRIERNVELRGIVTPQNIADEMAVATALVMHSVITPENNDKEGTPVVVMEAMCAGLPIIATQHEGIGELLENETSAILVEEYSITAMAAAMKVLISNSDLGQSIAENAKKSVAQHAFLTNYENEIVRVIENAVGHNQ